MVGAIPIIIKEKNNRKKNKKTRSMGKNFLETDGSVTFIP